MNTYDFGCAIRHLRLKREMTQLRLSQRSGVSRSMIVRVEKGERNISAEKLGAIARSLGLKPQDIYDVAGCCYGNPDICICDKGGTIASLK